MLLKTIRTGRTSERVYPVTQVLHPKVRRLGIEVARATPGVPQKGHDDRAPPKEESPCPGCRHGRANDDWTHTRVVSECGHPHTEPYIYECEACMRHYDARDSRHLLTPGKCRYRTADATRSYAPRTGRHPRPPAIPASGDPTSGMSGTKDGKELGHEAEEENLQRLRETE